VLFKPRGSNAGSSIYGNFALLKSSTSLFYNKSESHLNFADGLFKLPYRVVFAVATLNSLYVYDTESVPPILIHAGLHYAAITDIAW
jgi:hypothetical protein